MNAITSRQRTIFARLVDALRDAGRTHEIEDVMRALRTGDAQVWVENDSVIITELLIFPRRSVPCAASSVGPERNSPRRSSAFERIRRY